MEASTMQDRPAEGVAGRHRVVARMLRGRGLPPEELADFLLPLVWRAIRTERGPEALVRWLAPRARAWPAGEADERAARALTEELIRSLLDSPDPWPTRPAPRGGAGRVAGVWGVGKAD